ncbi:MAG: valS, partial [Caulobacteraceae bacterium]|nr:valS [Caulobacteraceae bacterium]
TDALRFNMVAMSGQARDLKLSKQRIEGYRNFGTKLWNAARFCQMNECARDDSFDPAAVKLTLNRWIRGEALKTASEITTALNACAFDDVANGLYRFIWNVFCDWYVELAKPILNGTDETAKAETRCMAAWTLDQILRLLHPVMPFLTEELWDKTTEFGPKRDGMLISAAWPSLPQTYADPAAAAEIGRIIEVVSEVRSLRAELNVPPSARPPLNVAGVSDASRAWFTANGEIITALARVDRIGFPDQAPKGSVSFLVQGDDISLPVADFIDLVAEQGRLAKEIAGLDGDIERAGKKLSNPEFMARAKEEVVEETREKLADAKAAKAKLAASLARLQSAG